ncbi:MAG: tail fiber domain-containing protein [Bacteroidota bacterium]
MKHRLLFIQTATFCFSFFYMQYPAAQKVGIGTNTPSYRLHVVAEGLAIYGNSTGGNSYGVWGSSTYLGVYGSGSTYGVYGSGGYGVYGSGSSHGVYGNGNYGIYGSGSTYGVYGTSGSNYGVYGNSGYLGVYGIASSYGMAAQGGTYGISANGSYIGAYGSTSDGTAVVGNAITGTGNGGNFYSDNATGIIAGTKRTDKNWAAIFNGNVYAYGVYAGSDRNFKKNIEDLDGALKIIGQLKPKTYEFVKEGQFEKMNLPSGKHFGLIAQEVEQVLPGLVKEMAYDGPVLGKMPLDSVGPGAKVVVNAPIATEKITSKAVNYVELISVMIKAMQELSGKNEALEKQVIQLQQTVNQLQKGIR